MAARHRALARLHRHVPHVSTADERALGGRVVDRATDDREPRVLAGEALVTREEVHERSLRGPQAGPNAPLMIRLIRYPFALRPVRPGRRPDSERPMVRELIESEPAAYPSIRAMRDEDRVAMSSSPMDRDLPEPPPHPFARVRDQDWWFETVPVEVP